MACIKKRGKRWQVRIHRHGRYESKTFTFRSDAVRWARSKDAGYDRLHFLDSIQAPRQSAGVLTTVDELLARYLKEVTPAKRGATAERYRIGVIRRHPLAKARAMEVRGSAIAKYRDERLKVVANNTVKNELNVISAVFEHARGEWDMELVNPVRGVRRPQDDALPRRVPSDDDLKRLYIEIRRSRSLHLYPVVVLAIETAARLGELLALTRSDISFAKGLMSLTRTKNGSPRLVPLTVVAIDTLRGVEGMEEGGDQSKCPVFPCSPDAIKHAFKSAARRANLGHLSFHSLRHYAVTRLINAGFGPTEVAHISGHKTVSLVQRYTHHTAEALGAKLASVVPGPN